MYVLTQFNCHGQEVTQGQFLSEIKKVWIQTFRLAAYPEQNKIVCSTIYP